MEPQEFKGRIARWYWEAEPYWPPQSRPGEGAPNILIVLLDDVGFAQLGCFGSDIATPNLDRLAASGLRFTNFHTTAMCSPTRACVLTGRNHHVAGIGRITQLAMGFPGYDCRIPRSVGLIPEMLTPLGYATWAIGKWHLTPEDEAHLGATRERWPLGRGFERFYGFHDGETHQNAPALFHDNHQVAPPRTIADGYHLTEDLVDRAIEFTTDLRQVDPDKPFYCYLATGACHAPHQAPAEFIDRYRGRFDDGWDVWRERTFARQVAEGIIPTHSELSPRPDWVPAWDDLSERDRTVFARYMEAFAGMLTHTDHHVGRYLDFLAGAGDLDNTLVMVLSDNGASSEGGPTGSINDVRTWNAVENEVDEAHERLDEIGGPRTHTNYPWGWTVAGNTPFRRWKREVHEGGVADPLIVHWPARLGEGGGTLRRQYVHAIDVVPTILDAIGADPPVRIHGVDQRPLDGISFLPTFADADATERHTTQYYEMFACRAIYNDGWKLVTYHDIQSPEPGIDQVPWELYDLRADPSECHDVAVEHPDKVAELDALFWAEAERNQVLPLDNRPLSSMTVGVPRSVPDRVEYTYWPGSSMVPEPVAVNLRNRPHRVRAAVVIPEDGASGVIVSQGSLLGGWVLYLTDDGRPRYVHNRSGREAQQITSPDPLPPGEHDVTFAFGMREEQPTLAELFVNGAMVGSVEIPGFTWHRFSITGAGLCCGWTVEPPVVDDLVAPARFTGVLHPVVVEVSGRPMIDAVAEAVDAVVSQ